MSPEDAVRLCRYVKACCPQQAIDELTPLAWADHLEHVPYEDAKAAAKEITAKQPFVTIAEILQIVRRIRASRIEDHPPLTPPPAPLELAGDEGAQVAWQLAWVRDARRRVADGEVIDSDAAYGELKPRHLPDVRALMPAPDKEETTMLKNVCPECAQGKHANCDGQAFDDDSDAVVDCGCARTEHEAQL